LTTFSIKKKLYDEYTKHNWTKDEIIVIYNKLMDLFMKQHLYREHPNVVQVSTLLSIKTGGCPEDCGYCPQQHAIILQ
jgi:biotin synthase